MAQSGDFILVYFLDDVPIGKTWLRSRNAWPLHVTLVPWFGVADKDKVVEKLEAIGRQTKPFDTLCGGIEQFNEQTTVTMLQDQSAMQRLHTALLEALTTFNAQLTNGRWIRGAYRAHVTHHVGMRVPARNEKLRVKSFSLVSLLPMNQCRHERLIRLEAAK